MSPAHEQQIAEGRRKRFATAQARLALRGAVMVETQTDAGETEFIVSWGAMTKAFGSVDAVERWLDFLDGKAAGAPTERAE